MPIKLDNHNSHHIVSEINIVTSLTVMHFGCARRKIMYEKEEIITKNDCQIEVYLNVGI